MKRRCSNDHDISYPNYGGRGITICPEWRDSFARFLADMGKKPAAGYSLERRDNSKGYSPTNCFWATRVQQANNKRNNRRYTIFGERLTVGQICRKYNVNYFRVYKRLKNGWCASCTLSNEVVTCEHRAGVKTSRRFLTAHGNRLTIVEWSKKNGIRRPTISQRLGMGWCEPCSVSLPKHRRCTHRLTAAQAA